MTRIPMSTDDAVWLRLDRPENVLAVVSVLWTATPVDPTALRSLVVERMLDRHPVFGARPVLRPWPQSSEWEPDPDFDLDRHLAVGAAPCSAAELHQLVGGLRAAGFDRRHPLWRVRMVPHGPGSAVVLQVHHSLADGIRLTRLMVDLLDPLEADADLTPPGTHLVDGVTPGNVLDPRRLLQTLRAFPGTWVRTLGALGTLLTWSNDRTAWSGRVGATKHAAWGEPLPLARLSEFAHRQGATVNELLMAIIGGAVRRVLDRRGGSPQDLAWMVPVNLSPYDPDHAPRLGNQFSLVLAVLPLHGDLPQRLAAVHARSGLIRGSWEPWLTAATQRFVGAAPAVVGEPVARFFADKAVGVLTNVPGPPAPMALAGAEVLGSVGWAPCSGDQAVTVCVFSYAGKVFTGFGTDGRLVGDADVLVRAFAAEAADAMSVPA
jgi:WS/DGAT/MGAT family acyltransferase